MKTSYKKWSLLLIILVLIILGGSYYYRYYQFHHQSLLPPNSSPITLKVPPGFTIIQLAEKLHQQHLIKDPHFFVFMARRQHDARKIHFGEYWIKPGMSAATLLNNIIHAKGIVRRHITFIEGWTFTQMKLALSQEPNIRHLLKNKTDPQIMAALQHPLQNPEGLFFPATYYFTWGDSDIELLQLAYQKMQQMLNQQWQQRASSLPYQQPYQALIVASLIEKETAVPTERFIIAGIILQRLKKNIRLQIDPTVLYGLHKPYGSPISRRDLMSDTPYNTYRIFGLPPTPIAMPGLASIYAALHPEKTDYLYYVAKGNGGHVFSVNYTQHRAAVKKYKAYEQTEQEVLRTTALFSTYCRFIPQNLHYRG